MKNAKNILIANSIVLIIILIAQLISPSIGSYLLDSKIEFLDENSTYWIAKLIETSSVQGFCLLVGLLNISLIAVSVNHLLKQK
ncbi:hypothetical protein Exig_3052 (plasmid) [Exiguobacterium sibiricum 255-15]|uniref:Uncharacterized protein n=1 Tax=Exiguobacterium sibiricum (strain DSM 17290 / CCUG 55495 / CIP 109462 / JCM 13490 / 255-15) TaxID=262543 RepID=B1YMS0_EXIS2|nr:hypothetical protein [Exiguobacterium sibiricum]ACB62497.1 hypothetical protein Exig_3052 [Exiguobacterium sibiricum 255-15]